MLLKKPDMDAAPQKKIIHIDMDAFYASVEQRDRPELRGRPVIVGGDPASRGVVASCSYEARKFGIRSAMASAKAHRLCPRAVFVRPDIAKYRAVGQQIREIFRSVTPLVEPLSIDEAYLDVTENLLHEPLARVLAVHIKDRIQKELGLTASAGVGPNKFVAKVASDLRKPNGLVIVPPEKVLAFVEKLPVEKLWGVGPATAKILHEMGLMTAADIRRRELPELERRLGKFGRFLYRLSYGEDDRVVETDWESKSTGTETTFDRDVLDVQVLMDTLEEQAGDIARDLRKIERRARTITLKLRYDDFKTVTRSRTLPKYTDDEAWISRTVRELLTESTEAGRRAARLIGVTATNLIHPDGPEQLWLDIPDLFS
jgi:DNA polymerase-4